MSCSPAKYSLLTLCLEDSIRELDYAFQRLKGSPDDPNGRARWANALLQCKAASVTFLDAK